MSCDHQKEGFKICSSTPKWENNQANRREYMFNEQVGISLDKYNKSTCGLCVIFRSGPQDHCQLAGLSWVFRNIDVDSSLFVWQTQEHQGEYDSKRRRKSVCLSTIDQKKWFPKWVTPKCYVTMCHREPVPQRWSHGSFWIPAANIFWAGASGHANPFNSYSYGHLSVISTYNPIYRMYNPIYNHL